MAIKKHFEALDEKQKRYAHYMSRYVYCMISKRESRSYIVSVETKGSDFCLSKWKLMY